MKIYVVCFKDEEDLEAFSSLESAIEYGVTLIEECADRYLSDDDDVEEVIENFRKYEYTDMPEFDISIYHLTLNE